MFTRAYIKDQIEKLEIPHGSVIIMHSSLRAVGKIDGGAETLLDLLIENITQSGGLLCIPTHTWDNVGTDNITLDMTSPDTCLGAFPSVALRDKRGIRSENPTHSMVVFGDRDRAEEFIKGELDVKTPTSPKSCYGKIFDREGYVLLVGVGQNSNTCLHSAEEMLDFPNRMVDNPTRLSVKTLDGNIHYRELCLFDESVHGDVSEKFYMYEPAFRARGAIRDGAIGSAAVQLCSARIMKEVLELLASRALHRDPLLYNEGIPEELYL